jgi:CBS domain containing-hemolysin-like protein
MNTELWGILAGVLLTLGTGVFVASEFSLVNLDRPDLERRRSRGEKRLTPTINALRVTSTHLSSAQLGITLTTLLAGYTFEPAISSLLRDPLASLGVTGGGAAAVGAIVAIVIATLFSMIFGELIPKNFALAVPLATAKIVAPLQIGFTWFFKPVVLLFNGTANAVIRAVGIEPKEELSGARSAEELSFLIRRSALEGTLDHDDAAMLHRTLTFSERTAESVMTPRVRMLALAGDATAADVVAEAERTGHSRFPLAGRDSDDILGIVHVKAAYGVPFEDRDTTAAASFATPPLLVPESAGVGQLLGTLRGRGYQIAVVVDEHGGTAGIVTLEDLVEELVGELRDEHDAPAPAHDGVSRGTETILFSAALRPDELWERAGVRVPESDDYETVAGFVLETLGRIPSVGDDVETEHGRLRVERMVGPRIDRLRYLPRDRDTDPAFAGGTRERLLDDFGEHATRADRHEHEEETR